MQLSPCNGLSDRKLQQRLYGSTSLWRHAPPHRSLCMFGYAQFQHDDPAKSNVPYTA
jgi:hypothetical protein